MTGCHSNRSLANKDVSSFKHLKPIFGGTVVEPVWCRTVPKSWFSVVCSSCMSFGDGQWLYLINYSLEIYGSTHNSVFVCRHIYLAVTEFQPIVGILFLLLIPCVSPASFYCTSTHHYNWISGVSSVLLHAFFIIYQFFSTGTILFLLNLIAVTPANLLSKIISYP